ncbi:hypothetical protein ACFT9I_18760 [Streptomyces sp. NPDC057137]|uniref:hypothetical protein n=1 Tax=Streptomyces sp. NPDC057137 TaxID=3346030 RepID=UPI003641DE04
MGLPPRTATDWTIAVSGVLALTMGAAGLIRPDKQLEMMGDNPDERGPGDHTPAVLATSSIAAVNMGWLYLRGVKKDWPGFPAFTVGARSLMAAGMVGLMATGRAPKSFKAAALWEGLGAAATGAAIIWDRRRA